MQGRNSWGLWFIFKIFKNFLNQKLTICQFNSRSIALSWLRHHSSFFSSTLGTFNKLSQLNFHVSFLRYLSTYICRNFKIIEFSSAIFQRNILIRILRNYVREQQDFWVDRNDCLEKSLRFMILPHSSVWNSKVNFII